MKTTAKTQQVYRSHLACLSLASLLAMTSCAHYNFRPLTLPDAQEIAILSDMRWEEAADVEVFHAHMSSLPPGVQIANGKLEVADTSRIEVIAFVTTRMFDPLGSPLGLGLVGQYSQDESWKDYWCPPNKFLLTVTIGLWAWLPPSWPCFTEEANDEAAINARKARLVYTLQKGAKALGGNTLIISEFTKQGDPASIGAPHKRGSLLDRRGQWGIDAGQAYGYVLLIKH